MAAFPWALALLLLQAAPEERARVEYVLVDVVARDRANRLVTDLTLDDFVVTDAGKKVALESLDILDLRREVVESGAAPVASPSPFLPAPRRPRRSQVIFLLDVLSGAAGPARQTLRWVDEYLQRTEPLEGLEYHLRSTTAGTLMEGFTGDPAILREVLDAFLEGEVNRGRRAVAGSEGTPDDLFGLEKRFQDCQEIHLPILVWNCVQGELAEFVTKQTAQTDALLWELRELPDEFTDPDALRSVVLLSPGFSLRPGRAARRLAELYLPPVPSPSPTPVGQPGLPGETPWPPPTDVPQEPQEEPEGLRPAPAPWPELFAFGEEYLQVLDGFARKRITFHAVDLYQFGIEEQRAADARLGRAAGSVAQAYRAYRTEMQGGPDDLREQTGGIFALEMRLLRPVLEGDRFVYVLGYRSPAKEPGQFRKLKVRCRRGSVKLVHRAGYVS